MSVVVAARASILAGVRCQIYSWRRDWWAAGAALRFWSEGDLVFVSTPKNPRIFLFDEDGDDGTDYQVGTMFRRLQRACGRRLYHGE